MNDLERRLEIAPAWDKRDTDPCKDYGIHSCEMRFYLGNDNGWVQFILYTNWFLPETIKEKLDEGDSHIAINKYPFELWQAPMPANLGYHSPIPKYKEQALTNTNCHLLNGDCYYDSSSLAAEKVFKILRRKGSEGVWKFLEKYWKEIFEEDKGD